MPAPPSVTFSVAVGGKMFDSNDAYCLLCDSLKTMIITLISAGFSVSIQNLSVSK